MSQKLKKESQCMGPKFLRTHRKLQDNQRKIYYTDTQQSQICSIDKHNEEQYYSIGVKNSRSPTGSIFGSGLIKKIKRVEKVSSSQKLQRKPTFECLRQKVMGKQQNNGDLQSLTRGINKQIPVSLRTQRQMLADTLKTVQKMKEKTEIIQPVFSNLKIQQMKDLIIDLREEISKFKRQNRLLGMKIREKQIYIEKMYIYMDQRGLENIQQDNKLRDKIYALQFSNQQRSNIISNSLQQMKKRNVKFDFHTTFKIKIDPTESEQKLLLKILSEDLKAVKMQLSASQKKGSINYGIMKKKEEEIALMRKNFTKNLNHYKQLIVKCTNKGGEVKRKDDFAETTIMEISSGEDG